MIKIDWQLFFRRNLVFGVYLWERGWVTDEHKNFIPLYIVKFNWRFIRKGIVHFR